MQLMREQVMTGKAVSHSHLRSKTASTAVLHSASAAANTDAKTH